MTTDQMKAIVRAAILAAALPNAVKQQSVLIAEVAVNSLRPTLVTGYTANAATNAIAASDLRCSGARKPVYRLLSE